MIYITNIIKTKYKFLGFVFLIGFLIGIPIARLMPLNYITSMTVTAARYTSDTKPGTQTRVVSLLASGSDSGELTDFALYLQLLTSTQVTESFFKNHLDLVHELYAEQWKGNNWGPPNSIKSNIAAIIYSSLGTASWEPPNPLSLSNMLSSMVTIERSPRVPTSTISVQTGKRELGIYLLNTLHNETERIIKKNAQTRSEIKAKFLMDLAGKTASMAIGDAIVEGEIRNRLGAVITSSPIPFAAEFIAKPDAPMLPNRTPLLLIPFLMGTLSLLGTITFFLFSIWRSFNFPMPKNKSQLKD